MPVIGFCLVGPGSLVSETKVLARRLKRILKWQSIEDSSNPYEVMARRTGFACPTVERSLACRSE
jgi:hypothetical protein